MTEKNEVQELNNEVVDLSNNDGFEAIQFEAIQTGFPKFHDFNTVKEFTGVYVGDYEYTPPQGSTDEKWTAHKFKTLEGIETLLSKNYQLNQAVEKNGAGIYKFRFEGHKELEKGKKVKEFSMWFKRK